MTSTEHTEQETGQETGPAIVGPAVTAIAWTQFDLDQASKLTGGVWDTDADDGQALAEFAGRACYQSWTKPNPATATNAGYLRHILEVGHLSVLEHASVTFYMTGVSRSFTHELVRHRHLSYSQLSQRYVPGADTAFVEPDVIAADPALHQRFVSAVAGARDAYAEIATLLEHPAEEDVKRGKLTTARKKAARQAARSVLPNAAETRIVVTGNYRAWRHFITMRATEHADVEIRRVAMLTLAELQRIAPAVFGDFVPMPLPDGDAAFTRIAPGG